MGYSVFVEVTEEECTLLKKLLQPGGKCSAALTEVMCFPENTHEPVYRIKDLSYPGKREKHNKPLIGINYGAGSSFWAAHSIVAAVGRALNKSHIWLDGDEAIACDDNYPPWWRKKARDLKLYQKLERLCMKKHFEAIDALMDLITKELTEELKNACPTPKKNKKNQKN